MNLTDNEIIKAFGNLYKKLLDVRYDLKITAKEFQALNSVNALVNRQKAEIERLQAMVDAELDTIHDLGDDYERVLEEENELVKTAKTEAIKEVEEKFKKALSEFDLSSVGLPDYDRGYLDCMTAVEDTFDNLVKEMTDVGRE